MRASGPTIAAMVAAQAARDPRSIAIQAPDRDPLTYAELLGAIRDIARTLHALRLGPHDRVALVLPNGPEMAVAFVAVAGSMTCAPLNPSDREDDLNFFLEDLKVKAVIAGHDVGAPAIAAARRLSLPALELCPLRDGPAGLFRLRPDADGSATPRRAPESDDLALVLHTSGTTARPKIVPLTQRNLCFSAEGIRRTLALVPGDVCLNLMPLFHIHGLVGALLSSFAAGASIVCTGGFRSRNFLAWLRQSRATWYTAVPTIHHAILEAAAGHSRPIGGCHLRFIRSSSAPLPPRTMADLAALFEVPVIEAYGMTEASHQIASNPLQAGCQKPGSVGPTAGPDVAIMGNSGELLTGSAVGEIVIRGETVTEGYERNAEANAAAFARGWFRTGDQGYFDADGYLYLTGRLKELINRGGEKIAPREVEEALLKHADVAQAVAFAVPHERLGEEVGAAVVLRAGARATANEISQEAHRRLPYFKVPRVIAVVDEIPKGPTGKVQRSGLAEALGLAARPPVDGGPPRTPLEQDLAREWERLLEIGSIGIDDDFFALGGDSLAAAEMIVSACELLGMEVPLLDFLERPTITRLIELRERNRGAPAHAKTTDAAVVLQTKGNEAPIFCIAPHDGSLWRLCRLLRYLGERWPIYGLRAPAIDACGPDYTIEELAERNVATLLKTEPDRRHYLIGCCFGGAVAFEMARRLDQLGRPVALLIMVNSFNRAWRQAPGAGSFNRVRLEHLARRARFHWQTLARLGRRERAAYVRTRANRLRQHWSAVSGQYCFDILTRAGLSRPPILRKPLYPATWALQRYEPRPYSGDVLMVRSIAPIAGVYPLAHMGWGGVAKGNVETVDVACEPLEFWSDGEHLQQVAAAMKDRLVAARPETPSRGKGERG